MVDRLVKEGHSAERFKANLTKLKYIYVPKIYWERSSGRVLTTEFIEGARAQAKSLGTDPALVFIPHPVQDRSDAELRALADQHFDAIIKLLVK